MAARARASANPVGALFRRWRRLRSMSQLDLAHEADVSPRHVCFVETGRARPSREMVLTLARALDVPLREQNTFLLAAGFAPVHRETDLDAPELRPARQALQAILRRQEPFPAVVMNRHWDILATNRGAARFFAHLLGRSAGGPANVLRMMFDPRGLRPFVANWEQTAEALLRRAHREAVGGWMDAATERLVDEVLGLPGVPAHWRTTAFDEPMLPVIPVRFQKGRQRFDFFSAVTSLGTPQDITLQELRIESFFPLDGATSRAVRELGRRARAAGDRAPRRRR